MARLRINAFVGTLLVLIGCGGATTTPKTAAPMVASSGPSAAVVAKAPEREVYLGVVGMLPVRATLTRTADGLEGSWVYEERGSSKGLVLEGKEDPRHQNGFDIIEKTVAGEVTGKVRLDAHGAELDGQWEKPGTNKTLPVHLAKELRVREGQNTIKTRRILVKKVDPPITPFAAFVPTVEGPIAVAMGPNLALEKLAGISEADLSVGISAVDFEVVYDDENFVTLATSIRTMGAYPSGHVMSASFAWTTGARVGKDALLPAKRDELVRVLDKRVHDAWRAKKDELMKGTSPESSCGAGVVTSFMTGPGPSFSAKDLESIHVEANGIAFQFDYAFPHVAQACSPTVGLGLSWSEARPFLDPDGSLAVRARP